ncbi:MULTISPECIES: DUF6492 family protein [unclassified Okeania]|uniref:DUF6492 family protein n=1 Tax=unclassified Okeania TaxID=2634635 RepID=UPI00257A86F2|nr:MULTISPECIES: DUF6492 family protein [unclassified Okeania]
MSKETFDFVIPLYKVRWNTQAVIEGITHHYKPRTIHIIAPESEAQLLEQKAKEWQVTSLYTHKEEYFFQNNGLTKEAICSELDLGKSLYNPGWFYQQLLKLGADEGIDNLSEWFVAWDSDLLPVNTWQLISSHQETTQHKFALLQHNQYGNPHIVSKWAKWITSVLGVESLTDHEGTFIPHHMWFKQEHLKSFKNQLKSYFQSDENWLLLMMRSANQFETFSEYWSYISWVAAKAPADLAFYPYENYGATTERFFDDGTGLFSAALRSYQSRIFSTEINSYQSIVSNPAIFSPSYIDIESFIREKYEPDALPSSLSFESSPRHLKKDRKNTHIEEQRSQWNPRKFESDLCLNLGCGARHLDGYINVDKFGDPDIRLDLETFPWPWKNNSVAEIEMSHVLEHLGQQTEIYLKIIQEIYRICKPGAKVHIKVPHHRHDNLLHDPTHVRPITPYGLSMFSQKLNKERQEKGYPTTPLGIYLGVNFDLIEVRYIPSQLWYEHEKDRIDDTEYLLQQSSLYNNLVQELDMTLVAIK